MVRVHVRYTGRVQGVGFRATCRSIARGHPVTGWVRNEADGSVTLEAQGKREAARAFFDAVGARLGRNISTQHRSEASVIADEADFRIRR